MAKNRALFLDRDGVICRATPRGEYLLRIEQFELLPGIRELIQVAKTKGYLVIVVTNQACVAQGLLKREKLDQIHEHMQEELGDAKVDAIYVCTHGKEDNCLCRKPRPGMLLQAADDHNLDLADSIIIGDSDKDIDAGFSAGCKTIFLKNEQNERELEIIKPDAVIVSLREVKAML